MILVEPMKTSKVPVTTLNSTAFSDSGFWKFMDPGDDQQFLSSSSFQRFPDGDVTFASVQLISDDIKKEAESPHPLSLSCQLPVSQSDEGGSSEIRLDTRLSEGSHWLQSESSLNI
ncbi:hypothetical protein ILYODFUR_017965 [Ilyodon furcidens]|uniref:Uncharacterized protein n=1 Tax=Ilyodon furcidens TaxID=33524 RepID=A0ABV0UWW3_9TELE